MPDTIFDKILSGDLPSHCVYEDDAVYAFLDIAPLAPGHTLIIPRERKAFLHELTEESSSAIGRVLPRIARAVMQATGCEAYNLLQNNGAEANQAVFHVHFHIIPRVQGKGLGIGWKTTSPTSEETKALLEKIRAAL